MSTKLSRQNISARKFLPALTSVFFFLLVLSIQGCEDKMVTPEANEQGQTQDRKNPHNPPPPPTAPFYFSNCNTPTFSATFVQGNVTNGTITKNYVNSPGGSYPAFTSETVNGVTISTPAGTFNTGSGTVVFTATGTPVNTGSFNVWIRAGNIQACMMFFKVVNAPVSGPTVDPGPAFGSTGIVNFIYRGQPVAYKTVRAKWRTDLASAKFGITSGCIRSIWWRFLRRLLSMGTLGWRTSGPHQSNYYRRIRTDESFPYSVRKSKFHCRDNHKHPLVGCWWFSIRHVERIYSFIN